MKNAWFGIAVLLLAVVVLGADTYPVTVLFSVADKKGMVVRGLRAEDFTLSEDGKEQRITSVTTADQLPATLASELQSQYMVNFESSNTKKDGKLRKIRVNTRNKDLKTYHTPGYYPEP